MTAVILLLDTAALYSELAASNQPFITFRINAGLDLSALGKADIAVSPACKEVVKLDLTLLSFGFDLIPNPILLPPFSLLVRAGGLSLYSRDF